MPSQEDYLDNLLKDMAASEEEQGMGTEPDFDLEKYAEAPIDLDTVSDLTEDEIEKLLTAGAESVDEGTFGGVSDMELPDEDVLKMLEESDDSDLQDIQELLEKADKDEAVDDSIEELLQDVPEEDLEAKILGTEESDAAFPAEDKKKTAKEKKALARAKREEQAAAKKAEKKAAKEAAKEAKAAAKQAKAAQKAAADKKRPKHEQEAEKIQPEDWDSPIEESEDENLFDMSVLDSIVSEADIAGDDTVQTSVDVKDILEADETDRKEDEDGSSEPLDVFAEEMQSMDSAENANGKESSDEMEDGGLGLDLGSLFGDEDGDASLMSADGSSDFNFSDFADSDAKRDAFGTDLGETEQGLELPLQEKKGFFSKILDLLTEEDEEEAENENIRLSQENQDILKDLDSEEKGKKGKKGKNAKKAKEKEEPKKEAKPKKQPKPKREPKPKKQPQETPLVHEKKLSFKKVFPVVLVGVSIGVLLFVFVNSATDYTDKREARAAFYEGDYQTCYQNLFGKKLDETESIMYGKSESILYIRLWLREYEMFAEEGAETEALDSLIQTVDRYPELYAYANQWNAESEVAAGYATILNILADKYGLTESEAMEIAAVRSDVEYTRMVTAIAQGKAFGSWNEPEPVIPEEPAAEELRDKLPEEDELGQETFIDNQ